ncbi:MAG: DUF6144 family protein [bacterium]
MGNPNWIEKLRESLDDVADPGVREEVLAGSEAVADMDEQSKAAWVKQALDKLDRRVDDEDKRYDIMARCSCECAASIIPRFREVYRESGDIDALLEAMYKNPFYVRPRREGNVIYFTKVAHNAEEHRKATTEQEKRYFYCHCDWIRCTRERITPTHCYCSAGWYRNIFEGVFERPVKVRLLKSVMQGDDTCEFAVYL